MHVHNQTELLRLDDIRVALKEGKSCLLYTSRSRDIWNQRHPTGSIQGTSMYTGRLICSSCGGVYSIYKQSGKAVSYTHLDVYKRQAGNGGF